MKSTTTTQKSAQGKPPKANIPRPEIRDNLDSRENEEFDVKGDDVTHTKKAVHSKNKKNGK